MGGSLALALKENDLCASVVGVARRVETVRLALEMGAVDRATTEPEEALPGADVVVLAMPVRTIIEQMGRLAMLVPEGCILTDLGSTKGTILEYMDALPGHIHPIGGHPMCGKDESGLDAAEGDLYRDAPFVLSPLERTPPEVLELMQELAEGIGAHPLVVDAERHDRLVAAISHMPLSLAVALVSVVSDVAVGDDMVWELASSGFRDTTRLASSEVQMCLDILMTNRGNVREMLARLIDRLSVISNMLRDGEEMNLRALLKDANRLREDLS